VKVKSRSTWRSYHAQWWCYRNRGDMMLVRISPLLDLLISWRKIYILCHT